MLVPIFVISVIVGILGVFVTLFYLDQKRTEGLEELAGSMGLEFLAKGDMNLQGRLASFQLFNQGRARKLRNLMVGETDEVAIAIFDYQYTTGSGKNTHTWKQTVALLESDTLRVPPFTMRPESIFHRLGEVFGLQDIDFESHPEFSKMFLLKSDHEDQVREYFDDSILNFFETQKGLSVEANPGRIIFYQSGRSKKVAQIRDFFETAYQAYGVLVDRLGQTA